MKLFNRLVNRDDAWSAKRVNILASSYFTALSKQDEIEMLNYIKENNYARLKVIVDNLEEYFDLNEGKESFVFGCTDIDSLLEFLQDNQGIEFEYSFKNNGVQIIPSESDFD